MNSLKSRLGAAVLLLGTAFGATVLPSFAWGGCGGNGYGNGYGSGYGAYSGYGGGYNQAQRAEVFGRDAYLNNQIRGDRGYLNGNFGRLAREDGNIRRQAQRDSFYNGGYMTNVEARRLNRDENRLQQQISYDRRY